MREEEASLMIIRHAIEKLAGQEKQQVYACAAALRDVMGKYETENAGMALMLIAAEVAAE